MIVDSFSRFEQLDAVRARWDELYAADPHANFFLSWEWLRACYATEENAWTVLGVRDGDGQYVAFLPLSCGRFPRIGPPLNRELCLAGSPRADYTGMLALPGSEPHVVPALARHLASLAWDNFSLQDYRDPRLEAIVAQFAPAHYRVVSEGTTPSPYIELPATWDEYLATLSHSTRRTIRSKLRKVEALPGFRLEVAAAQDAAPAIEALLRVNSLRWNKSLRKRRKVFAELFARCYAADRFVVVSLYDGATLLAAQGSFVDPQAGRIFGYMMGYNAEFSRLSPGMMLVCMSIRRAISLGYRRYDLARGGEAYKASLATHVEYTTQTKLTRRTMRVAAVNAGRTGFFAAKGFARSLLVRPA
jgi:CelD/BcsL family acetyltransferase involved in cellulose biosynthesis